MRFSSSFSKPFIAGLMCAVTRADGEVWWLQAVLGRTHSGRVQLGWHSRHKKLPPPADKRQSRSRHVLSRLWDDMAWDCVRLRRRDHPRGRLRFTVARRRIVWPWRRIMTQQGYPAITIRLSFMMYGRSPDTDGSVVVHLVPVLSIRV